MTIKLPIRKHLVFIDHDLSAFLVLVNAILSREDKTSSEAQKSCLDFLYKRIGKDLDKAYSVPSYEDLQHEIMELRSLLKEQEEELNRQRDDEGELHKRIFELESKYEPEETD